MPFLTDNVLVAALLTCPAGNTDYNAVWPAGITAGTKITGSYCQSGWTGSVGRLCLSSGQWDSSVTGSCTRTTMTQTRALSQGRHHG